MSERNVAILISLYIILYLYLFNFVLIITINFRKEDGTNIVLVEK